MNPAYFSHNNVGRSDSTIGWVGFPISRQITHCSYVDMWTDGWRDGRTDGRMDGWMDGWMVDGYMHMIDRLIDRVIDWLVAVRKVGHAPGGGSSLGKCDSFVTWGGWG